MSIKHFGKCKLIKKRKIGKKPCAGIGNPNGGNQPHQGHHPHPDVLDVNEPDEAASNSGSAQPAGDAAVNPVYPTNSGAEGEQTTDYSDDL